MIFYLPSAVILVHNPVSPPSGAFPRSAAAWSVLDFPSPRRLRLADRLPLGCGCPRFRTKVPAGISQHPAVAPALCTKLHVTSEDPDFRVSWINTRVVVLEDILIEKPESPISRSDI